MLKRVVTLGLTGLAAAAMTASPAAASSHREAPLISNDPVADLADTFMWVDQKDSSKINLVMTANPLENPGDAPNYYGFGQHVRYQFNIDDNGDARTDISYRVVFRTHVRNKGTFLYNIPGNPVTSLSDVGLNVYQTYSVDRLNYGKHGKLVGTVHLAKNIKTVPNNVGPESMPNYPAAREARREDPRRTAGRCGPASPTTRSSSASATSATCSTSGPKGAPDTIAGFNVQSIALQVPKSWIVKGRSRRSASGPTRCGGLHQRPHRWRLRQLGADRAAWQPAGERGADPAGQEGRLEPRRPGDRQPVRHLLPEPRPGRAAGRLRRPPRKDILSVFQTGVSGLNNTGTHHAEMLRLNTSIAADGHGPRSTRRSWW